MTNGRLGLQQKDHYIDGKKIEAKAAVPKNSNNSPTLTRKMFVGGTVSTFLILGTFLDISSLPLTSAGSGISPNGMGHCMQGEIGDEEFKEYFSQYGDIEDSVVSCTTLHQASLASFRRRCSSGRH